MDHEEKETAVVKNDRAPIKLGKRGLELTTLAELSRWLGSLLKSSMRPKNLKSIDDCIVAIQHGGELNLGIMASLQHIACINGRPALYGDGALAVVRGSGFLDDIEEFADVGGGFPNDDYTAICRAKRIGSDKWIERTFSIEDAKRAKLWGKEGPWKQYPKRMLQLRARSFTLRDGFGDALNGIGCAEEVQDIVDLDPSEVIVSEPTTVVEGSKTGGLVKRLSGKSEPQTPPETPEDENEGSDVQTPAGTDETPEEPLKPSKPEKKPVNKKKAKNGESKLGKGPVTSV